MNKTLRRLAAALLVALPLGALAQSQVRLELKDGSSTVYKLSESPKVSFADGKLNFGTETSSAAYDLSEVEKFYFEQEGAGISAAKAGAKEVVFEYTDGRHVTVSGVETGALRVFDTAGRRVQAAVSATRGKASIDLGTLPAGTYVIQATDKQSIKITKK